MRVYDYFLSSLPKDMPEALKRQLLEDLIVFDDATYIATTDEKTGVVTYEVVNPLAKQPEVKDGQSFVRIANS